MTAVSPSRTEAVVAAIDRGLLAVARHWLLVANVLAGLFSGLTVAAPLLMWLGWETPAHWLYRFYALNCHQLPQRSYFLFGPHGINTYSLQEVLAWGADPHYLRGFVGNAQIGYKLAMAERTTALFAAIFVGGVLYAVLGRFRPRLSRRWCLGLMAPMALDGLSHLISEVTGLGFRVNNGWAAWLTGHAFPSTFYAGTVVGTLNWWLRTATGALFGLAVVWLAYPLLAAQFQSIRQTIKFKLNSQSAG